MDQLHLIDLNLLPALLALLQERHVTRASERLGISQSAMSRALGRLREHFGDELLTKTQTGMVYTPLALKLIPKVESLCEALEDTLLETSAKPFDPSQARGQLKLASSEYALWLIGQPLIKRLADEAPHLTLHIVPPDQQAPLRLGSAPARQDAQPLYSVEYVQADLNARLLAPSSLEELAHLNHLEHHDEPSAPTHPIDRAIAQLGLRRQRALCAPSLMLLAAHQQMQPSTLLLPAPIAQQLCALLPSMTHQPLTGSAPVWSLYLEHEDALDPEHSWLKALLEALLAQLHAA